MSKKPKKPWTTKFIAACDKLSRAGVRCAVISPEGEQALRDALGCQGPTTMTIGGVELVSESLYRDMACSDRRLKEIMPMVNAFVEVAKRTGKIP